MYWRYLPLIPIAIAHLLLSLRESQTLPPPGKLIDLGGYKIHLLVKGEGDTTVVLDHSLGGIEGYFLIDAIAAKTRVCIYDRPGYGWSEPSPKARCSADIVQELDLLLTKAGIEPPYILVGDSFGSYNVRLYAHQHPEKVQGIVLTDGLHESGMLNLPPAVVAVKYLFISGFMMSAFGSVLGIVRFLGILGVLEMIKPEIRKFSPEQRQAVKRSFYRHRHWITMARELINLNKSSRQVKVADNFADLPIISIESQTFFKSSIFTLPFPLKAIDRLRDKMHHHLGLLSKNLTHIPASNSSHFVWTDEPEIIVAAIAQLLNNS
ncbi:MAG: alpha/beta hydrolase [Cyanobacteria bacterium P01_G01_bin.39]